MNVPMFSTIRTTIIGRIPGNVTCQVCFHRLAPSIRAASYSWSSIVVSAAR